MTAETGTDHCWLCYKPGAPEATRKLRALGYYIGPGEVGYAHASCIRKRERKLRGAGFPSPRRLAGRREDSIAKIEHDTGACYCADGLPCSVGD